MSGEPRAASEPRTSVERQRPQITERVRRHTGEIARALHAGRQWFSPEVSRSRVMLAAAIADAAVLEAVLAELDAIDASIAAGAGWRGP